ncbi:T9SS type A sorting domain-containing protein [Flavobacterium sp. IMCC34852]|uniref:T9SS type A sorting domain-containing protein n=1 Tax=Flavobacterium rivulicola TaxID=2732161 RepID=A0A7Y3RAG9_9FLAO|nr:carbohydrate binding domain-containing protein [Flavobacterium sp. IMCC34852]NNT72851.1 T9SS type A sorting domain-containing protein [Flavobacterium sp. IMCC34852]
MKKITFLLSILFCSLSFSQNIVTNGDFSNGLNSWSTFVADWIPVAATINATNNEANIVNITGAGGATWHVQLNQVLTPTQISSLTVGQSYKITFDARGSSARQLKLYFGEDGGGFVAIHQQDFNLTTTMTNYEATFTLGQTFGTMKLGFEGGLSNVDFFIDNVTLQQVVTPPTQLDLVLGFETTETGGINGAPFGNGPAPVVQTGIGSNTSQVLRIDGNPTGEPWQGINLTLTSLVNLTATKTMTMDVYSDTPITFLVKVTGGVGGPAVVAASASHPGGSTWQTVSFTFNTSLDGQPAPANGTYGGFVIHTYWAPGAVGFFNPTVPTPARTFYVDNIRGPLGTPPVIPAPTVAAPTPPNRAASDVRSIFSDAYAPVTAIGYTGDDNSYNTSWCPATTSLVQVEGNNTNRITGLGCEGIGFLAGRFDATGFTHFHMDIWTPTATQDKVFSFKFSNWNGTNGETNAWEYTATNANVLTSGAEGTWISIDLPFSAPTFNCVNTPPGNACPGVTDFAQFVMTSNLDIVYYDNLYLHKNTVLSTNDFETPKARIYPNPVTDILNIESEMAIEKVTVYNVLGQEVISKSPNTESVALDVASLQAGVYVIKTAINGNISSTRFIKE